MRKHKLLFNFWMLRFRLVFWESGVCAKLWGNCPRLRGIMRRRVIYLRPIEENYLNHVRKEIEAMRAILAQKIKESQDES